jgi:DNA gyrase subunit A
MTTEDFTPAPLINIEDEMRKSYLDYAMSVIVSRALPDVRDGLKPVHRRILYAMKEGGYDSTKPYRKSARIVGDVMGKYHPHGDTAIYDAMVRMAQDFSLRLPLIDGQGNFGSMDGDNPAAMRYTEARLAKSAEEILIDYDKNTVDFRPNYDDSEQEPVVLPARFPNLLVNGAGGIAVGMATNIPPHNLGEVIDACCALVDNPDLTLDEVMQYIQGPDFPTGGQIIGKGGILKAFREGKGSLLMRSKTHLEKAGKDRTAIIVDEVPYQTNKSKLVERIGEVVREKLVEGISEVRDESDRDGVRIVIELKRDAEPDIILNQLFTHTGMQTSFGVNTVALNEGRPETLTLLQILHAFVRFREEVIRRRSIFELAKAREKAHILVGLAVAVANIDEIIRLIRAASDPATAREQLMSRDWPAESVAPLIRLVDETALSAANTYRLSEAQARAILDLRLHRLTGLERDKIAADLQAVVDQILDLLRILGDRAYLIGILKTEMLEVKEKFGTPRRTEIMADEFEQNIEDLIQREDMVVTVTHNGYIKRVPLSTYRAQNRGGKGRAGMATRAEDFVSNMFIANTHTPILFFTSQGRVYQLKTYTLPTGGPQSRGKPMVNLLPALTPGERISAILPLTEEALNENGNGGIDGRSIVFITSKGNVRRNALADFVNIKANGKIAMKLAESGETLVEVCTCDENDDVFIATKQGKCIRFPVDDLRVFFSRNSTGVRGIKLAANDAVISMSILRHVNATSEERDAYKAEAAKRNANRSADAAESLALVTLTEERFNDLAAQEQFLLTVTDKGFGKRSSAYEYRTTGRGGQGIACMQLTKKNGNMIAAFPVGNSDQVMLTTNSGQMIRCAVDQIRIAGRSTQGVTLFKVEADEKVVSVAHIDEGTTDEGGDAATGEDVTE